MASEIIHYQDIQWDNIDYTKVSKVVSICRAIKEHYWSTKPVGAKKSIVIESGADYDFLVKAFSMYHTEWVDRTGGCEHIGFFVALPDDYPFEKAKCFNIILDGCVPEDSFVSHDFKLGDRRKSDILKCCRDAVRLEKDNHKKAAIGQVCKYSGVVLTKENIDVHHSGLSFSELANNWIEENGGVNKLHKYVSPSINGGDITRFIDDSIRCSFYSYHKQFACLEPISREAHKALHKKRNSSL